MQERDLRLPDAGARRLVDQPQALVAQPSQDGLDVVDLVGHVVQARAALGEELADRRIVVERGEQLDMVLPHVQQRRLDALRLHGLTVHQGEPISVDVEVDRLLEVAHREADVVDAPEHRPESRQVAWLRVRIALIANAASGGGLDPEELAERMRRHGAEVRAFGCEPEQLEPAAAWAPERVAVAGGDGTVGTVAELAGRLRVPPAGGPTRTAHHHPRGPPLPDAPHHPCAPARTRPEPRALGPRRPAGPPPPAERPSAGGARAAPGGELRPRGRGPPPDARRFATAPRPGLPPAAPRRAEPFKSFLGPLAYPVGALRAAITEQPLRCTVSAGGEPVFDGEAWQATVAVTGAFGGGAGIDAADPDDGVLDAAILPAGSRLGLARRAWGLRRGTIAEQRDVRHARGTVVEVDLPAGTEFNVDGEVHDSGMERITVEHRAYELVIG